MVMVGIDAHKRTLACCVVDQIGREVASKTFKNDADGHRALRRWAQKTAAGGLFAVAIESAYGFARRLVELLLDEQLAVFDVPPKLVDRQRRRRGLGKSDVIDAREIARAALREQARLVALTPTVPVIRELKLLVEHHAQLRRERTQTANRLHVDLAVLVASDGAVVTKLNSKRSLNAAEKLLEALPESVHRMLALGRLARVRELDRELWSARKLICSALQRSGTTLQTLRGVGPLTAARILAEVRDVRRFQTADAFARVNGTAPVPASSGERARRHRLNRGGNRRLNHALHLIAVVQIGHDGPARDYLARKRAEGKTHREAMRCVKRRLSDIVWRQLVNDLTAAASTSPR
jgi:transposase